MVAGAARAPRPVVEETAFNPLPTTRTPGVGATTVFEGREEGATAEDATAKEAVAVEAFVKRVATEHAAIDAATEEAVTEVVEDVTAANEGWRSY